VHRVRQGDVDGLDARVLEERVVALEELGLRRGLPDLPRFLAAPRGDGGDLDLLRSGGGGDDAAEGDLGCPQDPEA
jgi:hypothetical protein